ncbi:MAG: hypothetical protein RMJ17_02550, partial [Candidatus Aenigmarchaeota archaeon]|nr:hypothetical protein [Candidatus Aenigmarchaeota archaeon]MDW8149452.1 hypothetical protein [Candidatus Aenigmarchaeota archaeon]
VFVEVTGFDLKTMDQILKIISIELDGEIYKVKINDNGKKEFPIFSTRKFYLTKRYVNKNLGLKINESEIINLLNKVGIDARIVNKKIEVIIPPIRFDIIHDFDLLDEIARAYNFNNFELIDTKTTQTIGEISKKTLLKEKIAELMVGQGFIEASPFSITSKEDQFDKMNLEEKNCVKIKNPLSKNFSIIRVWILPELLKVLSNNIEQKQPIKIFEVGDVLELNENKWNKVEHKTHLCFLICGEKTTYTNGRQYLEAILDYFKINYNLKEIEHRSFIKGRVAGIFVNGKQIGFVGEILPEILYNFKVYYPVTACEIEIEEVFL